MIRLRGTPNKSTRRIRVFSQFLSACIIGLALGRDEVVELRRGEFARYVVCTADTVRERGQGFGDATA